MNDLMTKSFMSYVDLKKAAMKDLEAGGDGIELPESGAGGVTDERLRGFFQEAEAVKAEMAAIRDALDRLHAANEEGKSLHQVDALRAHRGREVERSLLELHQVFLDMAVMVEMQGEKLDDIESHVASASHYVQGGNKELGKAKEYQRSSRKCLCIGIIILLLLVLLVIVPIATSLRKS
uniref:t-SNARE coiled-coil homology domain-containing protein n=1 Tax=Zea mays TaxID=4577 RepID=B6TCV7_MAIZE|nr:hypothetical protein [Zea mays]